MTSQRTLKQDLTAIYKLAQRARSNVESLRQVGRNPFADMQPWMRQQLMILDGNLEDIESIVRRLLDEESQ